MVHGWCLPASIHGTINNNYGQEKVEFYGYTCAVRSSQTTTTACGRMLPMSQRFQRHDQIAILSAHLIPIHLSLFPFRHKQHVQIRDDSDILIPSAFYFLFPTPVPRRLVVRFARFWVGFTAGQLGENNTSRVHSLQSFLWIPPLLTTSPEFSFLPWLLSPRSGPGVVERLSFLVHGWAWVWETSGWVVDSLLQNLLFLGLFFP
jgi:hypothetical protein